MSLKLMIGAIVAAYILAVTHASAKVCVITLAAGFVAGCCFPGQSKEG